MSKQRKEMSGATVLAICGLVAALVQSMGYAREAGGVMLFANALVIWFALVRRARQWFNRAREAQMRVYRAGDGVIIREKVRGVDGGLYAACSTCGAVNDEPCDAGLHS